MDCTNALLTGQQKNGKEGRGGERETLIGGWGQGGVLWRRDETDPKGISTRGKLQVE